MTVMTRHNLLKIKKVSQVTNINIIHVFEILIKYSFS
jgi:hypothetical protein